MNKLEHAIAGIEIQQNNRRLWSEHDDALSVAMMLLEESQELVGAITESFVTGDVFTVASEIGDILYLVHRMCNELGFDPADLIELKTMRNSMKYADAPLNNGYEHDEAILLAKSMWKQMGGDNRFSHAYLELFSN